MSRIECLNVAIDAPVMPETGAGVAQFIGSLISALGQLQDGSETYTIIAGSQEQLKWLRSCGGANQQFVLKAPLSSRGEAMDRNGHITFPDLLKRAVGPLLPAARYIQRLLSVPVPPVPPRSWPEVPVSDGFYERLGCDVIHIPLQNFVLCALPIVYNPHDLQHLHYPQFFTPATIAWRETIYPAGCHFAHTVAVGSQWIKDDIVRQYRIAPEKVQVIPEGPPTELYPEPSEDLLAKVKNKYQLQQPFALYPAVTWQHKNHLRLVEALAYLRGKHGLTIQVVFTGSHDGNFWRTIEARVDELKLRSQVRFLGFVPAEELRAIYRLSQFLVVPSLFEAISLPIFEAWLDGVPVACSNATALPDQVMDAALLFEPRDVGSIANAIEEMATNTELQRKLRERGYRRLKDFDWQRTARAYRAVYRRAAGCSLTEEDRWLLTWDWMRKPQKEVESRP
jgi:glycosyltransferase involved in cell wall biosynthesis